MTARVAIRPTARLAIRTRFVGPTNYRPSRVIATDDAFLRDSRRRKVVSWDYQLDGAENHMAAAQAWLDLYNPGHNAVGPGLNFDNDLYWAWEVAE